MSDSQVAAAAEVLHKHGIKGPYACAMILGTGLGNLASDLSNVIELPYCDIPDFPVSRVSGHEGKLVSGQLEGKNILIFQGRAHFYETGNPAIMRTPIGVLTSLGSPPLLITNAAGSLTQEMRVGSLVLINDHINFSGLNPLIGEGGDTRFVQMTDAYDENLRRRLKQAALSAGIALNEGVYMWFSGPSFETPAEIKMARMLGADLVGMSTVPEVILARRFKLRVAAISVVTNMGAGIFGASPSHKETRDVASMSSASLRRVIRALMNGL